MNVRLTDGTTTTTLTSGVYRGVTYFPQSATAGEALTPDFTLTEEIRVVVSGTAPELIGARNVVEDLLTTARRRQTTQTGNRVFVEYQNSTGATWFRSEILDGRVDADDEPMLRRVDNGTNVLHVLIERQPWWEGARTLLVDAETIANGESGNSVEIAAEDVEGTLPAPVEIRIENAEAGAVAWRNFYLACNAWNDPENYSPWLSGSAFVWSNNQTHNTSILAWTLTDAQLTDMQGDYFRFVAGFTTAPSADAYMKLRLRWNNQVTLVEGDEVYTGASGGKYVVDMGTFPVPPGGYASATLVSVRFSVRAAASGAGTLDWIAMLPANNFRKLRQVYSSTAAGASIVDDGIEGVAYVLVSTSRYPLVATYGAPLMVWPGRVNTIYVLYDENGDYTPANTMDVSVWYRPRRLTI